MGGAVNPNGITLKFFDVNGNPDASKPPIKFALAHITAQPRRVNGVGSQDWMNEVYLAPDPVLLYQLMRNNSPTGTHPPLTTAASQHTLVYYFDQLGQPQAHAYQSVVGLGTDVTVNGPNGPERLRVFDTLEVTDGDAAHDTNNGLHTDFINSVIALTIKS